MKGSGWVAAALGVVLVTTVGAEADRSEPDRRLDFRLPAPIVDLVGLGAPVEGPGALVLVGEEGEPRTLLRADVGAAEVSPPRLTIVRRGLAPKISAVEVMEHDDGEPWIVLGAPGRVVTLGPLSDPDSPRSLLEAPGVALDAVDIDGAPRPLRERPVVRGGRLDALELAGERAESAWSVDLPVRAELAGWGLRLTTPPVSWVATEPPTLVAIETSDDRGGDQRIRGRATVVREGERTDVTLDLSETGQQLARQTLVVDGEPHLATVSIPKLGLFVDRVVRLYRLTGRDPSERVPSATLATDCPLWSEIDLTTEDLDGDGGDDLLLGCSRGFERDELRIEAYRGVGGRFDERLWRRQLAVEAVEWTFRHDVTGDGRSDLVTLSEDRLAVRERSGGEAFTEDPLWSTGLGAIEGSTTIGVEVGSGGGRASSSVSTTRRLVVRDLDADGIGEIALVSEREDGRTVLSVFR